MYKRTSRSWQIFLACILAWMLIYINFSGKRRFEDTHYSMRENTYLVAGIVMLLILITYFSNNVIEPFIRKFPVPDFVIQVVKFTILIVFVFTFLRPISQFIYF